VFNETSNTFSNLAKNMVSIFPCKQILQDMTLVDIINGIAEKEHT